MKRAKLFLSEYFGSKRNLEKQILPSSRSPESQHDASPQGSFQTVSSSDTTNEICFSKFESLPFDIRHQILLRVDFLEDLRALVQASPIYHAQYLLRREFWLWRCLWLEMSNVVIDAYTADLGNTRAFRRKRTRRQVLDFAAAYHSRRSRTSLDTLPTLPSTEAAVRMAAFHLSTVKPLLEEHIIWARTSHKALSTPDKLSRTEKIRILRGLYRFQIYCNLFGCSLDTSRLDDPEYKDYEKLVLFLGAHEPWETEEIICISTFVDSTYQKVFMSVEWDLHPENPKFDDYRIGVHTPEGAYHLSKRCAEAEWYSNGMASLGLVPLCATFQAQDHAELVNIVSNNLVSGGEIWIKEVVSVTKQEERREKRMSHRDRAQDRQDKLPFRGDREDSPPLAWVTVWRGTYSNLYGQYMPETPRNWGYIMWDADRLVDSGGKAALELAWNELYPPEYPDPRIPL